MDNSRISIQFKFLFFLVLHVKLRIWFIAGVKATGWPKSIARFSTRAWNYNYRFGQSRTRLWVRISFRSYVCACTQEFGFWFVFMFRVSVTPTLQRRTFKVDIMIHWYLDLDRVLAEFGFSIMIGFRMRVVLKIWIFCLSAVSFRLMGGIKSKLKIWIRLRFWVHVWSFV